MKITITCLLMALFALVPIQAEATYQFFKKRHHDEKHIQYTLHDIASTQMPLEALSTHTLPLSEAPKINNSGKIIYNDVTGGYLWDSILGNQRLLWHGVYARFHAINNDGTVLASAISPEGTQCWILWTEKCGRRLTPTAIEFSTSKEASIYLRDINDNGMISGFLQYRGDDINTTYGIVRTPTGSIYALEKGIAWSVSVSGFALANDARMEDNTPYLWHHRGGILVLSDHGCIKKPQGIRYVDMLLTDHGAVYGTFFFEDDSDYLRGFYWDPRDEKFQEMEICGMRISAINGQETLVGDINGRAAVKMKNQGTFDLNRLIDTKKKSWILYEATDINDFGQIVGYGQVDGKTRIFMLEPTEKEVIKISRKR